MAVWLVDSSAVLAILDADDRDHERLVEALRTAARSGISPILTNFLRAEAHALIGSRLSWPAARQWVLANAWPIERVTEADEARAIGILRQHRDKSYSLVDSTSFAVMERLGLDTAFTLDRHFRQFGFKTVPAPD